MQRLLAHSLLLLVLVLVLLLAAAPSSSSAAGAAGDEPASSSSSSGSGGGGGGGGDDKALPRFSRSCSFEDVGAAVLGDAHALGAGDGGGGGGAANSSSTQRRSADGAAPPPATPCTPTLHAMRSARRPAPDGPASLPGACAVQWHSPADACARLSRPPTTVAFVGDSISRHFMHAMQLLVRGDAALGALREGLPANVSQGCSCDRQFVVRDCRQWILKDTKDISPGANPCPAARVVHFSTTKESEFNAQQLSRFVAQERQQGRAVVLGLGGWGMHNGLMARPVFKGMVQPLRALMAQNSSRRQEQQQQPGAAAATARQQPQQQRGEGPAARPAVQAAKQPAWQGVVQAGEELELVPVVDVDLDPGVHLLCLGLHAVHDNVPDVYKHVHNNRNVATYNRLMHALCTQQGIPFFDTYPVTANASSFDGIHYGLLVNVLKAQLLLNHIADVSQGRAVQP